jgi:C_GCAxxG_C_C family probable redox protein
LFRLATTGVGSALVTLEGQQFQASARGKPLTEGDRFNVGERGPQMVARAQSLGREYEGKYGNCAQCTIAALQDSIEFIPENEHIFLAGSCLHGGATPSGNANCGGFTGAGIVIGHLCGRSREQFGDREAMQLASRLIREMTSRYEQVYGSVICRDVREKASKNCLEVVARAAGWAAEVLLKQFSK